MMDDLAWRALIEQIKASRCTPFIGAGACYPTLPLGKELARELALHDPPYPLKDCDDLMRVAQYYALKFDLPLYPKDWVAKRIRGAITGKGYPNFLAASEPHSVLADLNLPVYLTTNYDDFMAQALRVEARRKKKVHTEYCRWNSAIRTLPTLFEENRAYEPTAQEPLVFHLHGMMQVSESLVMTEDDYIDFLVKMNRTPDLLPPRIQESIRATSLLFLGYRLSDWNFRVLFRWLVEPLEPSIRGLSVTVQIPPEEVANPPGPGRAYLEEYFRVMRIRVFWGTAEEFATELRRRIGGKL